MNEKISETVSKLHFQRFEFKYLVDVEQYEIIKRRLQKYLNHDPFVASNDSQSYDVISLYFDSPKFYSYWEKIDGARKRKKIRLRTYKVGKKVESYSYLEIKRKFDAVVLKDRCLIDRELYQHLDQSGGFFGLEDKFDEPAQKLISEFEYERCFHAMEPKVLVVYKREPYVGHHNNQLRVTFDYNIKAYETSKLYHDYDTCPFKDVSKSVVVMEVKFNGTLPPYIADIIREYSLLRVPYSKYCESLESIYTMSLLQMLGNHSQSDTLRLDRSNLL